MHDRYGKDIPAGSVVGHNEVGEATVGDVVKKVLFPDIGKFTVIGGDLG